MVEATISFAFSGGTARFVPQVTGAYWDRRSNGPGPVPTALVVD
jgi:hypothetical protein